jgi:hypothetical protein
MSPTLTATPRGLQVEAGAPFHHVVSEERIIQPIFAAQGAAFHPAVERYWRVLENAAAGVGGVSPEQVVAACEQLMTLLRGRSGECAKDGLVRFRREFCLGQLESIVATKLSIDGEGYLKALLTGDASGLSTTVDSSIRAGVADFNERYISLLRRRYSAKDGLGEKLVSKLSSFQDAVEAAHPGVGIARGRDSEQALSAQRLLNEFGKISREVKMFLSVLPEDRMLATSCDERLDNIRSRLRTNHFGGVLQISSSIIGDIRQGINVLRHLQDPSSCSALEARSRGPRRG